MDTINSSVILDVIFLLVYILYLLYSLTMGGMYAANDDFRRKARYIQ